MSGLKNGDITSLEELYHRYHEKLYRFFFRMLGNDEEKARDFLQDIFLKTLKKASQFDCNKKFSSWIFAMANNMCKNEYRRMKIRKHQPLEITELAEENSQDTAMDQKTVLNAIGVLSKRLNPEQRAIFFLRYQENMPIRSISEIVKCPEGTVKSRFHINRKLADWLKLYQFKPGN